MITWLEIRDYLEEWDEERGSVTAHFEDQRTKRITEKELKLRIDNIHTAIVKNEENKGAMIQKKWLRAQRAGKPKGLLAPVSSPPKKLYQRKSEIRFGVKSL